MHAIKKVILSTRLTIENRNVIQISPKHENYQHVNSNGAPRAETGEGTAVYARSGHSQ